VASTLPPRARLGLLLKRARTAAQIRQAVAATHAGVAQGTLSKIEDGRSLPSEDQVRALIGLYGIDAERTEQALALREECAAHKRRPGVRLVPHTAPHFQRVADFEGEALSISGRFNLIIPGLLQTEGYAKTLFELSDRKNISEMVAARLHRQINVLSGPRPPMCTFVLHEACLHNTLGRPEIVAQQLEHLLALGERDVTLAVLPYTAAVSPTSYDIWLYRFPEGGRRPCAVVEYETGTLVIDSAAELRAYEQRLHLSMLGALHPLDSRQLIQKVLDSLR
jgi:transcriptional regulator with XRE-family HTH domain